MNEQKDGHINVVTLPDGKVIYNIKSCTNSVLTENSVGLAVFFA